MSVRFNGHFRGLTQKNWCENSIGKTTRAASYDVKSDESRMPSITNLNPLESSGNYRATSNIMKLVHWPLMGGLLQLVQRGRDWAGLYQM